MSRRRSGILSSHKEPLIPLPPSPLLVVDRMVTPRYPLSVFKMFSLFTLLPLLALSKPSHQTAPLEIEVENQDLASLISILEQEGTTLEKVMTLNPNAKFVISTLSDSAQPLVLRDSEGCTEKFYSPIEGSLERIVEYFMSNKFGLVKQDEYNLRKKSYMEWNTLKFPGKVAKGESICVMRK